MNRNIMLSLSIMLLTATGLFAQQKDTMKFDQEKLFVSAQIGIPAAQSNFSSFGADKYRPVVGAGISAGYRFTDVWSLEMTAMLARLSLAEKDCCMERHYFLGSDLERYHPALVTEGMKGHYYDEILSKTIVQKYGLQANMNILGFFQQTKSGPWRVEFSPAVYAVGTSSDILTKTDKAPIAENINKWHLGYGAQIQASYSFAENMKIGLYGGFTQLTGKPLDGMPKIHTSNNIINAGIKFTFGFKKSGKISSKPANIPTATQPTAATPAATQAVTPAEVPAASETAQTSATAAEHTVTSKQADAKETVVEVLAGEEAVSETTVTESPVAEEPVMKETAETKVQEQTFPVIYFSFNSIWIEPEQRAKVKEIADRMKADKSIRVRVTGWCDPVGSAEANQRVSLQRAEAVKRVLGQWLVPADRIETVGGGINHDAASHDQARSAITIEIL